MGERINPISTSRERLQLELDEGSRHCPQSISWVGFLTLLVTCSVNLGKLLSLTEPQFLHLHNASTSGVALNFYSSMGGRHVKWNGEKEGVKCDLTLTHLSSTSNTCMGFWPSPNGLSVWLGPGTTEYLGGRSNFRSLQRGLPPQDIWRPRFQVSPYIAHSACQSSLLRA